MKDEKARMHNVHPGFSSFNAEHIILRSLVSYQRCTNCSSIHKTIVPSMCALVKKATSNAVRFQALMLGVS